MIGECLEFSFAYFHRLHSYSIIDIRLGVVQSPGDVEPGIYPKQVFCHSSEYNLLLGIAAFLCCQEEVSPGKLLSQFYLIDGIEDNPGNAESDEDIAYGKRKKS